MLDPKTRKALSVAVFEDREALERCREALASRPNEGKVGIAPDRVDFYETFAF
jgi:hypothetical protein